MEKKPLRRGRWLRHFLSRRLAVAFVMLARRLPLRWLHQFGDLFGGLIYMIAPSRQRLADLNLKLCFGDRLTPAERKRIRHFATRNTIKTTFELLRLPAMSVEQFDELVDFENPEVLDEVTAGGRGGIVVTAHFGNWELLAAGIVRHGHDLSAVVRDSRDGSTATIVNRARAGAGVGMVERSEVRKMIRVVRGGGLLGMLPDLYATDTGVMVDFMGHPARTYAGPATFALLTHVPIIPGFARRTDDDHIVCYFREPFEIPDTGDREADVLRGTQMINDALGHEIMRYPAQWLWLHHRWRPELEPPEGGDPGE